MSHLHTNYDLTCTVCAGVNIILYPQKQAWSPKTTIIDYPDALLRPLSVTEPRIISILQEEATQVGSDLLGFYQEENWKHSFQSDSPIFMHITGVPDHNPMSIILWCYLGFMVYIKNKIYSSSAVFLVIPSQQLWFQKIWPILNPHIRPTTHLPCSPIITPFNYLVENPSNHPIKTKS